MKKFNVTAKVSGNISFGTYEADTSENAIKKALEERNLTCGYVDSSDVPGTLEVVGEATEIMENAVPKDAFLMCSVKSSNINKIGHDEHSQVLRVEFSNGNLYEYYDVKKEIYEKLQKAESVGSFFSKNIRNSYKYKKLEKNDVQK
ncbi:MAG: KTSC domain-containing protein [Candidatus Nanoarchaeia archaeon]|jgi:hypothetical protein|nr:KTSC domain-containing protein [Candidatus Nanoarchaeia archaeon]